MHFSFYALAHYFAVGDVAFSAFTARFRRRKISLRHYVHQTVIKQAAVRFNVAQIQYVHRIALFIVEQARLISLRFFTMFHTSHSICAVYLLAMLSDP